MADLDPDSEQVEELAESLYRWSGGIFWRGETTWQDRHRNEARQWFAYAASLDRLTDVEALAAQWERRCRECPCTRADVGYRGRDGIEPGEFCGARHREDYERLSALLGALGLDVEGRSPRGLIIASD